MAPTREAHGRPVGLMAAWLLNDIHVTPHEHIEPFFVYSFSHETRARAREHIMTCEDGPLICSFERDVRDHEGPEPNGIA